MADSPTVSPSANEPQHGSASAPTGAGVRRNFFSEFLAVLLGGLVGVIPAAGAVGFLLHPLRKKAGAVDDAFVRVAKLDELPVDGTPVRFNVVTDKTDAWNVFRNVSIGTVYLRRMPADQIVAYNDTCPHLGCKVDYQPSQKRFFCPCHASAFSLEGEKQNAIPPRNLDVLDAELRGAEVWVKYQTFLGGKTAKIPTT